MLKVFSLPLLFLIRIRFPGDPMISGKSNAYLLRSRYGNTLVKDVRIFGKIQYKLQKCKLDLAFLETSLEKETMPKFLNFCVSNLHLKTSRRYHSCQIKLLREEISAKKSKVMTFEKDFIMLKIKLRKILGITDYIHIYHLFLNKKDRKLKY